VPVEALGKIHHPSDSSTLCARDGHPDSIRNRTLGGNFSKSHTSVE